ncbi:ABC transporter ATP-binding protein [Dactylosporangium aurantiacum]|uniref:ABC transporter ATP-binding protein n=1 Tax=Dactylosporangium aurantiacum TaxID=35754 RepID=A0A9Q9ICJ8_9ACTN|nr:ABC transporter ATP-binding protein [Dactylosporangium aurantiacum]MDG6103605.1 ABC transporter ATP-binding protein [Dactylosporangium aurantiacum]UWZ51905.1 ABC transporter ATP-binding protein [Dactylosporangium aurantiacum]
MPDRLGGFGLTLGYDGRTVADDLTVTVPDGSFTVIVGPNACGKSTLLRALARTLRPRAGAVLLDGRDISTRPTREVARALGLLAQSALAPAGITVADLVAHGRFPHHGPLGRWSAADRDAVRAAMAATGVADLAGTPVDALSGGQRQRVWIAVALAQDTPLLLLDEPTTYLDISHQIEVLELCARLHRDHGRTLVAVLHDLNLAARYATHLVAMRAGRVVTAGPPPAVVTERVVEAVFGLACRVMPDPETGTAMVIPRRGPIPGGSGAPPARPAPPAPAPT